MSLRNRLKEPRVQICLGTGLLSLAITARLFLHPGANFPARFIDGATGFLFGVSFGCMLVGIWRKSHPRSKTEAGPQAS